MHPALWVVFLRRGWGAGVGLVILRGLLVSLGLLPPSATFGFAALAVAVVLAAGGLASSVLHLGRPERAWRAFSQWSYSWLSGEGGFSVLTFLAAAVFGIGWLFFGVRSGLVGICGILAAALAAVTIYCTGMIYASLRPIHQWHNPWVVPNYFALGLMSALLVLDFLVRLWESRAPGVAVAAAILVIVAWWLKEGYWRSIDTTSAPSTVASATLLGSRGKVRMLEPPHTEENYLLKEMGFAIARKHRIRLRRVVRLTGFALPVLLTLPTLLVGGVIGVVAAGPVGRVGALGVLRARAGVLVSDAHHVM